MINKLLGPSIDRAVNTFRSALAELQEVVAVNDTRISANESIIDELSRENADMRKESSKASRIISNLERFLGDE